VKWLTDITEHPTGEGKVHLCAVKNCYSNKIVGYSIDARMKSSLAVAALRDAITLRNRPGWLRTPTEVANSGPRPTGACCVNTTWPGRYPTLEDSGGTTAGDRDLDRAQVSPQATTRPGQAHPDRV
jgi:hypothetical protein